MAARCRRLGNMIDVFDEFIEFQSTDCGVVCWRIQFGTIIQHLAPRR